MSAWTVWQVISGAPERMGPFASRGDALRVFRTTAKRRSAVYRDDARHEESEDLSARDGAAMDAAVRAWFERAAPVPAPAAVVELPAPEDDHVEPVGVGAATEAPLPVAFEPPVVEPAPRSFAERAADLRAEIVRGRPSANVEHLRVQLADATARAVAAEEALAEATSRAVTAERRASLDSEQTIVDAVLDAEAERAARAAATAERDALDEELAVALSRLGERDRTIAALRAQLAQRDRTIACLRAELAGIEAHPVVRITAPRVRRVVRTETPVETLHRRLAEIAEGRR